YRKEEFLRFIGHITTKNKFLKSRNLLMFSICYFCGLRPHELTRDGNWTIQRLKKIIDKNASETASTKLIVTGKGRGAGKLREIVIYPEVYQKLKQYLYEDLPALEKKTGVKVDGSIFVDKDGRPLIDPSYLSKVWRQTKDKFLFENDLDPYQRELWNQRDLYSTRHCYATNLIIEQRRNGKSIDQIVTAGLLGHNSIDTTIASYIYTAAVLLEDEKMKLQAEKAAHACVENMNHIVNEG
ncbi:hypothetical protein ASV53_24220, partial [Photobacterium sanguinicancri]